MAEQRVFTREELRTYDGKEGRPVYVAYQDKVYDVSTSKMWKTGTHMRQHAAGQDLTAALPAAPHTADVLERFPQVGVLEPLPATQEPAPPRERPYTHLPRSLASLLERVPFLERHPHPMTVHFPIVFMIAAPLFALLYLWTGVESFEITSAHILAAGVFFNLVGLFTGLVTWWINYMARPMRQIIVKIVLTIVMCVAAGVALAWRLVDPALLTGPGGPNTLYLALLLSLLPLVVVVATIGANLTFPLPGKQRKGA
jgi:predicted heme/steroid binding protein/uncharacterized membrane protein